MPRAVRKNGFQLPRSGDQKTVMVFYPLVTVIFYGILIWLEHRSAITLCALLLPHLFMVVVLLYNWFMVESLDPEDSASGPGGKQLHPGIKVVCFDQSMITTRYCASCRKQVYGLDHHCTWLNTCVGARNYVYFFALIVTGTCQMLYQSLLGILYMTLWREDTAVVPESGSNLVLFYCLVSFFCLLSVVLTIAFGVLMGFHLYLLLWIRAGTYDWMMGNKSDAHSRAKARAQKQKYETAYRKQSGGGAVGSDVRHGYITPTGDIEFGDREEKEVAKYNSDSSCDLEHQSASGDDISHHSDCSNGSSSLVSSRGTVELNDPDPQNKLEPEDDAEADVNIVPNRDEELNMKSDLNHVDAIATGNDLLSDDSIPTKATSSELIVPDDITCSENVADDSIADGDGIVI